MWLCDLKQCSFLTLPANICGRTSQSFCGTPLCAFFSMADCDKERQREEGQLGIAAVLHSKWSSAWHNLGGEGRQTWELCPILPLSLSKSTRHMSNREICHEANSSQQTHVGWLCFVKWLSKVLTSMFSELATHPHAASPNFSHSTNFPECLRFCSIRGRSTSKLIQLDRGRHES